MSKLEQIFEKGLWNIRYVVILSVILSIVASISLFLIGSWDIIYSVIFQNPLFNPNVNNNNDLLFKIISSIDLFLIGIVLLIFGFGVYELFISEIDFAKGKFAESTLKINNLDQLKNKIIKVIIIVLIVKFFEKILKLAPSFNSSIDVLYFAISILSICIGYYLINRK
jgi:uncharacterized membrane protein YqhA